MKTPSLVLKLSHHIASIVAHSKCMLHITKRKHSIFNKTVFIVEYDREYAKQVKEWI